MSDDGNQIDGTRFGFRPAGFLHHKAYGETPYTYLCAYIEELRYDSPTVDTVGKQTTEALRMQTTLNGSGAMRGYGMRNRQLSDNIISTA